MVLVQRVIPRPKASPLHMKRNQRRKHAQKVLLAERVAPEQRQSRQHGHVRRAVLERTPKHLSTSQSLRHVNPSLPPRRARNELLGQKVSRGPRQRRNRLPVQNRSLRRRTSRGPRPRAPRPFSMRLSQPRRRNLWRNMRLLHAKKSLRKVSPPLTQRAADAICLTFRGASNLGKIPGTALQKLILMIWPPVPTSHPASGLAKATAQQPVTPGRTYQVVPSSGVHAAPPVSAVTTT